MLKDGLSRSNPGVKRRTGVPCEIGSDANTPRPWIGLGRPRGLTGCFLFYVATRLIPALLVLALSWLRVMAQSNLAEPTLKTAEVGHGITLHYVDLGKGVPVIFVHGSLSDGSYWADQVGEFAKHYRAIAYSRRYNYPNNNPAVAGYSAVEDAKDLAALTKALDLGRVVVIGHSYGALTALVLAAKHPELVRALVLPEPPSV